MTSVGIRNRSLVDSVFVVGVLFAVIVGWCATAVALRQVVSERIYVSMRMCADMEDVRIR